MKLAISTIGIVFNIYIMMTATVIAEVGSSHSIAQLSATGGAEFALGVVGVIASLSIFWRPSFAIALFLCATAFALVIGIAYGDKAASIWALIYIGFGAVCWLHRKMKVKNVQIQ